MFAEFIQIDYVIQNQTVLNRILGRRGVLDMPTFCKDNSKLMESISLLLSSPQIGGDVDKHRAVMLCKLHYLCHVNLQGNETCILLNDDDAGDVQRLTRRRICSSPTFEWTDGLCLALRTDYV